MSAPLISTMAPVTSHWSRVGSGILLFWKHPLYTDLMCSALWRLSSLSVLKLLSGSGMALTVSFPGPAGDSLDLGSVSEEERLTLCLAPAPASWPASAASCILVRFCSRILSFCTSTTSALSAPWNDWDRKNLWDFFYWIILVKTWHHTSSNHDTLRLLTPLWITSPICCQCHDPTEAWNMN